MIASRYPEGTPSGSSRAATAAAAPSEVKTASFIVRWGGKKSSESPMQTKNSAEVDCICGSQRGVMMSGQG
mgnify:CR=1 FL=1